MKHPYSQLALFAEEEGDDGDDDEELELGESWRNDEDEDSLRLQSPTVMFGDKEEILETER